MKIAYIVSKYPAVSHTFILNEIQALRALKVEISTFSIRKAEISDILGDIASKEAKATRSILPIPVVELCKSIGWCLLHRPSELMKVTYNYIVKQGVLVEKIKWSAYLFEGVLLAYWLIKDQYDHLHCHFGNSGSNTALIASLIAHVPLSITFHGSELNSPISFRIPEKVNKAAFIACISKYGRAKLMHICKRSDWDKIKIVRCGIKEPEPSEYPVNIDGEQQILCVGRLSPEKGHHILLDAFEIIQKRNNKVSMILVGDGPLREELEERVGSLQIPAKIMFTGSLEPEKVSDLYKSSSLAVLASFSEGVPVVLMEAFSHGRPVVATFVGGIPELVENGINGLLVPPSDSENLADAIEEILRNPKQAEEMGLNGVLKINKEFNELVSAKKLKNLFETSIFQS
ncbi:glycosyltransferase family 4 protein [Spirochaeta isovalerica]|uniref:Glycosyltransferase involved in cell wall biosynthesis n=1 Tax=Spirochaeta isovalerica TaxID=150 RepID=A0A841R793_9SPIO|nr:glycosyltransferase family 4 protein [Spirochaeta isovalerica]MBB6479251.1 glycosyltransferase involved in cell wall biosynthesis [Spirochaeta isovalerica]